MRYSEFKINRAVGVILCSDLQLGEKFYPKGHTINAEDIIIFKMFNLSSIVGAIFEEGDVDYKIALKQVAAQISGRGIGYLIEKNGICSIIAAQDGVFVAEDNRIDKFNHFNEHIILNTIPPYSVIKRGDLIAELDISVPLVNETEIDDIIFRLSGNSHLLKVENIKEKKSVLLYPHLLNDEAENRHFTSIVMKLITNLDGLGVSFTKEISTSYKQDNLEDSLFDAFSYGADIIFVLSPVKTSGRGDIIAKALSKSVDDIVNYSMPQVNASDLLIAQKGNCKIVVLPYSYDIVDTTLIDNLIKTAIFTEYLNVALFNHKHSKQLFSNTNFDETTQNKMIMPSKKALSSQKASIGIVVLAAGQGRRSGSSKLLVEDETGSPLFMYAVNAAIASDAKPVFVVIGHCNEEMEEYLEKLDVNVLYNPSFASGIKTSINLGLKSIPSSCDGAILLPADMPNITASDINKLINKFDKNQEKQICLLANRGIKSNPILWSRSLYDRADIVPENSHLRTVFVEHADYTNIVEIRDKKKLLDVNFPNDIKEFSKHQ